jgi:hypothetical protein
MKFIISGGVIKLDEIDGNTLWAYQSLIFSD